MWDWLSRLQQFRSLRQRRPRAGRTIRPHLERLEERTVPATLLYSAATNPAITDYTLRLNGANVEVVETANTANVLASLSLATTTDVSIIGQNNVADTLRVNFAGFANNFPAGGLAFNG